MGLENTKMFHILSNGKLKELTQEEYFKLLQREGYLVGWVDAGDLCLCKGQNVLYLRRHIIEQIFSLFDNQEEASPHE